MFTKRLLSGIILVLIALAVVIKGGSILFFVTGILSLAGLFEF